MMMTRFKIHKTPQNKVMVVIHSALVWSGRLYRIQKRNKAIPQSSHCTGKLHTLGVYRYIYVKTLLLLLGGGSPATP